MRAGTRAGPRCSLTLYYLGILFLCVKSLINFPIIDVKLETTGKNPIFVSGAFGNWQHNNFNK